MFNLLQEVKMRCAMMRRDPWALWEEFLHPLKYGSPRVYESDVGTKEKPSIIVRSHMVERKYKAWRDPDGSYHEQLRDADDVGDDIESYGGTP